jgi:putative PEP-CTERM system TPR-repeat lipoprotein
MSSKKLSVLSLICLSIALVASCSSESPEVKLKEAQLAIEQGEYEKAEVLLKTVLSENGSAEEAHLQLATTYYFQGEFENALKEFDKLKNSNLLRAADIRHWLQSLLFTDSIDEIKRVVKKHGNKLEASVTRYYEIKANPDRLNEIELPDEGELSALVKCSSNLSKGRAFYTDCIKQLSNFNSNEHAFELATVAMRERDNDAFLSSVSTLARKFPQSPMFQILHSEALVRVKEYESASKIVSPLLAKFPSQGFLNYLQSVISFEDADFKASKIYSEKAIQNGVDNTQTRLIAAISAYNLEAFEQAYSHFEPIAGSIKKASAEYRIYSSTLLALGYDTKAVEVIESMDGVSVDDLPLYTSVASVMSRTASKDKSLSILQQFDSLVEGNSSAFIELNINKLALNDINALANLESVKDSDSPKAVKTALASYYLSKGQHDKALDEAGSLMDVEGGEYTAKVIEALVALERNSKDVSDKFNVLFSYDENSLPALFYFINKYIGEQRFSDAVALSNKLQATIPNSVLAITTHIRALNAAGQKEKLISFLKDSYTNNSSSEHIASLYAAELFNQKKFVEARRILRNFEPSADAKPLYWLTLIKAESALGNIESAKKLAGNWAMLAPNYKPAILLAANIYESENNFDESIRFLKRASKQFANDEQIKLLLASNYISNKEFESASSMLSQMDMSSKRSLPFKLVEGHLALEKGNSAKAILNISEYYYEYKTYDSLMLLVKAYREQKNIGGAIEACEDYLQSSGFDPRASLYVAELYIKTDHEKAISEYKRLLRNGGDSALVLNNLAWLYHVNNMNKDALPLAEKASLLEEDNPDYLDTLGMIHLRLGNITEAESKLASAFAKSPQSIDIVLHYVEILVVNGKRERAEVIVAPLKGRTSQLDSEVQRLLNL